MKVTMKIILCIAACLLSLNASAKCNQAEADKGIQPEMNTCAYEAYQAADKQLNILYKKRIVQLETHEKEVPGEFKPIIQKLKLAQTAWIKFKDADCEYEAFQYEGGSIQPLIKSSCLEDKTKKRIEDIKQMLIEH